MKFKEGDIVYGYCVNHKKWDYCVLDDTCDDWVFGWSKDGQGYYQMRSKDTVPEEIVDSPLWRALE